MMDDDVYLRYEHAAVETDRVVGLFTVLRESQRYGLMMVPTTKNRDRNTAVRLAALLLLQQVDAEFRPPKDIPCDWAPRQGTRLCNDAESLASLFEGLQLRVTQFWSQTAP